MSRPLFYVLDGHALAYRHYFASTGRPLMTSTGVVTSAIYGFARTIMDVLEKDKPHYLAVAFDEGLSGRDEYFPDYKAHRDASPQDFEVQMPIIRDVVTAFGIPLLMLPGYEADDLIGTATLQAVQAGAEALVYSGDRDMLQLLDENTRVRLYIPQAGVPDELYDVEKFRAKYELDPIQLIDLKALEGDTSDNIPGVAGIGKKGATTLLQQFGTLENIYDNLPQLKDGVRKKLEDGRESAFLSQRLATILRDVTFDFQFDACEVHPFDYDRIHDMFRELEFTSLIKQLDRMAGRTAADAETPAKTKKNDSGQLSMFGETVAAPPPAEIPALFPTVIVQDMAALDALVALLNAAPLISFDTETTATDAMSADLVGISLCVDGETGYYIPVGHLESEQLPLEVVINALREPLTNPNIGKAAHNADYDVIVLAQHGLNVSPVTFDTMIAEWVARSHSQYLGLKRLAQHHLGVIMTEISELIGTGKNQITMDKVPVTQAAPYAAADAVCTHLLVSKLTDQLAQVVEQTKNPDPLWGTPDPPTPSDVFTTLELPLIPVLTTMEQYGVLLDTPYLADMSVRLAEMLAKLEEEIYALSGGYGKFNINSPKQLNDVLFGKLGLKAEGVRKTTHGFSTAADVLESMRGVHPIIDQIMNYRELSKLKGTYVDALPVLINSKTGRVHTSFNQTGASTGRLSSSNPNLQNIPIRTETGREVRGAFIAPDGCKLLSVDYSQVELRIMAHITKEPTLLEAFARGQDIHAATAALVNRIPIEQVTKDQRSFAKRVNFGLLYGMGAFRLARDSELTLPEANKFIETYFAQLPNVKVYLDRAKKLASGADGYLSTMFGRRREFQALQGTTGNRNLQQSAEREAINMPIQGTAADIIKKAMIDLQAELQRRKSPAHLLLQVHDELVLEVPDDQVAETAALVVQVMESAADLAAPLKANAQVGQNWRDMTEV
jgi:DNA polymerase-1